MSDLRPLLDVVTSSTYSGRGSLLGEQGRRRRWWILQLACGHRVERDVRYRPREERSRTYGGDGWSPIPLVDMLPPPRRARCDECLWSA